MEPSTRPPGMRSSPKSVAIQTSPRRSSWMARTELFDRPLAVVRSVVFPPAVRVTPLDVPNHIAPSRVWVMERRPFRRGSSTRAKAVPSQRLRPFALPAQRAPSRSSKITRATGSTRPSRSFQVMNAPARNCSAPPFVPTQRLPSSSSKMARTVGLSSPCRMRGGETKETVAVGSHPEIAVVVAPQRRHLVGGEAADRGDGRFLDPVEPRFRAGQEGAITLREQRDDGVTRQAVRGRPRPEGPAAIAQQAARRADPDVVAAHSQRSDRLRGRGHRQRLHPRAGDAHHPSVCRADPHAAVACRSEGVDDVRPAVERDGLELPVAVAHEARQRAEPERAVVRQAERDDAVAEDGRTGALVSQRSPPADCANPRTVPCGSPCSTVQARWTYCVMARSAGSAASRPAQNSASTQASQQPARRQNFMGTGRRTINSGSNLGRTIDLVGSEGGSMVTQEGRAGDGERRAGGGKGRRERRAKGEGRLKGWKGQRACLSLPFSLSAFISRHFDLVA